MLVNVVEVQSSEIFLQLILFFVHLVHVLTHESLHIEVLRASRGCGVAPRDCWTESSPWNTSLGLRRRVACFLSLVHRSSRRGGLSLITGASGAAVLP